MIESPCVNCIHEEICKSKDFVVAELQRIEVVNPIITLRASCKYFQVKMDYFKRNS